MPELKEGDSIKGLEQYLEFAKSLVKSKVGPDFRDGFWRQGRFETTQAFEFEEKGGNISDCVTAVDKHVEKEIFEALRKQYPGHKFVGEETTAATSGDGEMFVVTDEPTWIVDPVAINHRFDTFKRLLTNNNNNSQDGSGGGPCVQNLRILGAAAPDLVYVARGAADLYWEGGPHVWDFAAGMVLVLESGGMVYDGKGWWNSPSEEGLKPVNIWSRTISAVRYIPSSNQQDYGDLTKPNREKQNELVRELLKHVSDIDYPHDGRIL
ncbi:hypothetical protein H4219_005839 [Mycoemilia scoparia]|uniref:Inositol-phosphate phosphatase n=1 Tax=Mycoemilia scoparia TaxID=417184 RepID=A0A9W8DK99_9FUNG|nr:hypothetical protein H4219_005839 [Mycoemilia scoparia]